MARLSTSTFIRRLHGVASLLLVLGVAALLWPRSLGGQMSYVMVSGTSMEPGLHTGDLVLVRAGNGYEVGDAIAYRVPDGDVGAGSVVIHRITGGDGERGYTTQGDNRDRADVWLPRGSDVIGERWAMVPAAGNLLQRLRSPLALGLAAAALTLFLAAPSRRESLAAEPRP